MIKPIHHRNIKQPVRKVVDLRTRNPTNFSLHFSNFSMIYYAFSNLQPLKLTFKLEQKIFRN